MIIIILSAILVICSALMLLIILMQRPKQEGLGASFGGGMTQDLFGAQTTNVLQKATTYLAVIFFVISLLLAVLFNRQAVAEKSAAGLGLDNAAPVIEETTTPVTEEAAPAVEETTPAVEEVTTPTEEESAPIEEVAPVTEPAAEALEGAVIGGALGTEAVEAAEANLDASQATEGTEEAPAGQ